MKLLKNLLIMSASTAALTYVGYKIVLNDHAKQGIKNAAGSIRDSYRRINEVVSDITGLVVEDDAEMPENAKKTLEQWKKLGY